MDARLFLSERFAFALWDREPGVRRPTPERDRGDSKRTGEDCQLTTSGGEGCTRSSLEGTPLDQRAFEEVGRC